MKCPACHHVFQPSPKELGTELAQRPRRISRKAAKERAQKAAAARWKSKKPSGKRTKRSPK